MFFGFIFYISNLVNVLGFEELASHFAFYSFYDNILPSGRAFLRQTPCFHQLYSRISGETEWE